MNKFAMTPNRLWVDPFFTRYPIRREVLQFLVINANLSTRKVELSTHHISESLNQSRAAVRRALDSLEQNNLIRKLKTEKTNKYQILIEECFVSSKNAKNTEPATHGYSVSMRNLIEKTFPAQETGQIDPKKQINRPHSVLPRQSASDERLIINIM